MTQSRAAQHTLVWEWNQSELQNKMQSFTYTISYIILCIIIIYMLQKFEQMQNKVLQST